MLGTNLRIRTGQCLIARSLMFLNSIGNFWYCSRMRPLGELLVVDIQSLYAVQHNHQMISVRRDLVVVPLVRNEFELLVGLGRRHDRAGIVARRLCLPNLHLVATGCPPELRINTPLLVSSPVRKSTVRTKSL